MYLRVLILICNNSNLKFDNIIRSYAYKMILCVRAFTLYNNQTFLNQNDIGVKLF